MIIRKSLEKKTLIAGIEIRDLGVILALFFGIIIFIGVMRMFIPISIWYNIAGIVTIGIYIGIVRYGLKNKHPSFIVSLLSYHFFQPKRMWMKKLDFIAKRKQTNVEHRHSNKKH